MWAFCRRFKLLCDPRGDSLMPSVVHSCSVFFLFIKLVVDPQVFDGVGIGVPNTVPHVCGLACCLGWFVVDTYSDLFATKTPPTAAMILHHVFCLACVKQVCCVSPRVTACDKECVASRAVSCPRRV